MEDERFVVFEWIGKENYLRERVPKDGKRTRGANCTGADAAVMFEQANGKKHIVLIEWKYTESYGGESLKLSYSKTDPAKPPTDRTKTYEHLFALPDCPMNKGILPSYDSLFFEPFYQLFRQQLLAREMEKGRGLALKWSASFTSPRPATRNFRKVTSPELQPLGESATGIWKKLLIEPSRFRSVNTEELFAGALAYMPTWWKYVSRRYAWLVPTVASGGPS